MASAAMSDLVVAIPEGEAGISYAGKKPYVEASRTNRKRAPERLVWGPTALAVTGDGFWIADAAANRVAHFKPDGTFAEAIALGQVVAGATALAVTDRWLCVLDGAAVQPVVVMLPRQGQQQESFPLPDYLQDETSGLVLGVDGAVFLTARDGIEVYQLVDAQGRFDPQPAPARIGAGSNGAGAGAAAGTAATRDVTIAGRRLRVPVPVGLTTYQLLGQTAEGHCFVAMSEAASANNTGVDLRVGRFDEYGVLRRSARVPFKRQFTPVRNGLAVGPDGDVYSLLTRRQGAEIRRLRFVSSLRPARTRITANGAGAQPAMAAMAAPGAAALLVAAPGVPPITRDQIMATAVQFHTNQQFLSAQNINGGGCAGRGTPRYLGGAGVYSSVPYDWGGSITVAGFNQAMQAGMAAGDVDTSKPGNIACSEGVDCSGFVSQCWGFTDPADKMSTNTLPDVSSPIDFTELKRGDILNRTGSDGHVRLFDRRTPDGMTWVYEATTLNNLDRVIRNFYSETELEGFKPLRYNGVVDGPQFFPQTEHNLRAGFQEYFERHEGVPIFGLPLSEEFTEVCDDGVARTVQYFERAVLEFHDPLVLLRLLGSHERDRRFPGGAGLPAAFAPVAPPANVRFYPETGHTIRLGFRAYYEKHGDLSVFGLPLSEEFSEVCDDGVAHTVQYFERAVMEFHSPMVLLRLLGGHERDRRYPGGAGLPAAFAAHAPL